MLYMGIYISIYPIYMKIFSRLFKNYKLFQIRLKFDFSLDKIAKLNNILDTLFPL